MKKRSLEEIRELVKDKNIEVIGEHEKEVGKAKKRTRRFIECQCTVDGYKWNVEISGLLSGQGCPKCNGNAKLTLEEIKTKLKGINPDIEILSTEYTNARTKLKCRCLIDGYQWETIWDVLQRGNGCPKCAVCSRANKRRLTIDDAKEIIHNINPNIDILSRTYINAKSKLKCRCKIDEYEWESTYGNLYNGNGCPKCGAKSSADKQRLTLEEVKEKLKEINLNIVILSKKYINAHTKLKCKCLIDNNEWYVTWRDLSKGNGCPICKGRKIADSKRLNIIDIKEQIKKMNPNVEIISNKYISNITKLDCKCLIHNSIFKASWAVLSQGGIGCSKCIDNSRYRLTIEEIKNELKGINPNIEILSNEYTNNHTKLKCKCLIHNCKWEVSWSSLQQGGGCPECKSERLSKENHYFWKGGITPLHEYLRHKTTQWKQDSFKKYNYKCDITKIKRKNLVIHHHHNFSDILQEVLELTNLPLYDEVNKYTEHEVKILEKACLELHYKYGLGICLTKEIHEEFHKIYGKSNNTFEQYEEFKKLKLKELNIQHSQVS